LKENIHKDHRKRVREEFLKNGYDHNTPPHKVLEHLLFYCIKQKDTNDLAHELINKYKNLSGVLDAPIDELIEFSGLTENNVSILKMIMPIARIYSFEKSDKSKVFSGSEEIGKFLLEQFQGFKNEHLYLLLLNASGKMLRFKCIADGDPASVGVSTRDIVHEALDSGCTNVIMAHNHPSGTALPSPADIQITSLVANALRVVEIHLLDHMVIADGDYVSMAQSEKYRKIFKP
jgi:DNA repair protein RadC